MNILAILGSSRKGGNTEILLNIALKEAKRNGAQVSRVALRDKSIAPCNGCLKCHKSGKCVIKDDMQEIYQGMLAADGILWATPVYFWSMTGQTKTVMDRTYALATIRKGKIQPVNNPGCANFAV
jgi:multimeric flavodoxin WrbA